MKSQMVNILEYGEDGKPTRTPKKHKVMGDWGYREAVTSENPEENWAYARTAYGKYRRSGKSFIVTHVPSGYTHGPLCRLTETDAIRAVKMLQAANGLWNGDEKKGIPEDFRKIVIEKGNRF